MQKLRQKQQEEELLKAFRLMPVGAAEMLLRLAQSYAPQQSLRQRPLLRLVGDASSIGRVDGANCHRG